MKTINRRNAIVLGTAAAAGIFAPTIGRAANVTLRISTPDSATHPNHAILTKFGNLLEQRSSGSVKIKIFPDGQLGTIANALTGLQTGTIDMAVNGASMSEGIVPELGVLSLPFMFSDEKSAERVIDGDTGKMLTGKLSEKGIEILSWSSWGWRVTQTSNRAIRAPKDFQGLKIRLPAGPVFADTFATLGAIPTVVDSTELYLAVSQGTVDGFEVPFLSLVASKWYEVVKYVSLTNHAYNPVWLAMSKRRLNGLAPEQAKIIRDTARELQPEWRTYVAEKSLESQKFIQDRGIEVIPVDIAAFRALLTPVYDRFKQKVGAELVDRVLREAKG